MILIIKGLGLLMIFTVCVALGFSKAAAFKRRARELENIICCLQELGQYLRYEGIERISLVKKAFDKSDSVSVINDNIYISEEILAPQDRQLLEEFFGKLGTTEVKGENDRVKLYVELLSKQHETAVKIAEEHGKLYRIVGLCAGAAGCLLMI